MYLLSGESLTKAEWFRPERQPLNLDGQKSTSSLTIGPEAPEIPIGAWMLDDEDPGAGIVWRVKTVDTQFDTKTRTVQLEHIVNTLKDISIFGEIEPKDITGNAGSTTCTARQAFEFILARHDSWQLGTMAGEFENISNPYSFNGEDLLSAMEAITSSLEDAYWDFDLTSLPFRVNILKLGEDVGCEMRTSRNITTLRKTVDRSRMYTRIYPIGENDIHIDGDYISQNVESYGLVVKIETDSSKKTKAELLQWAQERLARHCEPSVTITISGIELSEATGEPLDHFREHTKCRVPLPEFGTTITEKVTKLSWRDKIHEKKNVTITLANQREDIASIVNRINKKNAAGARAKAKKDKEDHAWFVDTEDHVGMVAEAIIGQGPDGVDWSRVASLIVDGEGIHGRVTRAEGYLVTMQSSLDMNEESLRIAFETAESLRSSFVMSAESLRIAFENEITSTRSEFQQTADLVGMIVEGTGNNAHIKPAKIQASINAATGTSKILLSADNVEIDGDLITGALEGEDIVCDTITTGGITAGGECAFDINSPIIGDNGGTSDYTWGDVIVAAEIVNTNTLRLHSLDGEYLDFSKATTLSPSWSSGAFPLTVNATQTNNGVTTNVGAKTIGFTNAADVYLTVEKNGDPTAFGSSKKLINVPFKIVHHAGGTVGDQDRYASSLASVDATSVYNNGWDDVELNTPSWAYPSGQTDGDNTTEANSLVVTASEKKTGSTALERERKKTVPVMLYYDGENNVVQLKSNNYVRAQISVPNPGAVISDTTLTGQWISGRRFHVVANPQTNRSATGIVYDGLVGTGNITKTGKTVYRDFIVYSDDGNGNADSVIMQKNVGINASDVYDDGWDNAEGLVSLPTPQTNNGNITFGYPKKTSGNSVTRSGSSKTYSLRVTNNDAFISISSEGSSPVDYAKVSHGKYDAGYNSDHNMFIGDVNYSGVQAITVTPGQSKEVWPYFSLVGGGYQWGTSLIINASGYTEAQYNAAYREGWEAGWNAYIADSADWIAGWDEGNNRKSVWYPKRTSANPPNSNFYNFYDSPFGRGRGNGSSGTCAKWFEYIASIPDAPHLVSGFDTTNAPSDYEYTNGLQNNSDGYGFNNNGHAYIVVKSTWKCDGVEKEAYSYLWDSAQALYLKGKADGSSSTPSISLTNATYVSSKEGLAYALRTSTSKLVQIFSNRSSWPSGYYGFKVACGNKTGYYYFEI